MLKVRTLRKIKRNDFIAEKKIKQLLRRKYGEKTNINFMKWSKDYNYLLKLRKENIGGFNQIIKGIIEF